MLPKELRSKNIMVVTYYINENFDKFNQHQLALIRGLLSSFDLSKANLGPYISALDEKQQIKVVKRYGRAIRWIKNPSEELQLEAVRQNWCSIENIKNPTEKVQLEAIRQNDWAIKYIENPTEKVKLECSLEN